MSNNKIDEEVEYPKERHRTIDSIGVFKVMEGEVAVKTEPKPTEMIIETILPYGFSSIIAGTTGCNKSYFAMQMGMSIANDENEFLGWEIEKKGLAVLYVDTECGMDEIHRRFKRISKNMDWKGGSRFNLLSVSDNYQDIWEDLGIAINRYKPHIVIIDCLYNVSAQKDYSKGHRISQITDHLTSLKSDYRVNVIVVHHFNKGNHEKGLVIDRMSGASPLQNWAEHVVLMTKTNEPNIRLMRIVKSRGIYFSEQYYALDWDLENQRLSMIGVILNPSKLLVDDYKLRQWTKAVQSMSDKFETKDFINSVVREYHCSERTAKNWLKKLVNCEILIRTGHGRYEKKLEIVDEIISEET